MMSPRTACVHEDDVVLCGPAPRRARPVVVRPDHLVEEAVATEDLVKEHLAVMRFTGVDVPVESTVPVQHSSRLLTVRAQPAEVVVEAVVESRSSGALGAVGGAGEPAARRGVIAGGAHPHAVAPVSCV